jgi:hypothetical protein
MGRGIKATNMPVTTRKPFPSPNASVKGGIASGRKVPPKQRAIRTIVIAEAE